MLVSGMGERKRGRVRMRKDHLYTGRLPLIHPLYSMQCLFVKTEREVSPAGLDTKWESSTPCTVAQHEINAFGERSHQRIASWTTHWRKWKQDAKARETAVLLHPMHFLARILAQGTTNTSRFAGIVSRKLAIEWFFLATSISINTFQHDMKKLDSNSCQLNDT